MHLSFSSLKPLWSRLRLSRSFESKPQARAGSRTAKPLTLNTIAAAAVSEDSLPFAEPKSPRGAPKGSTNPAFNITKVGREIEGDPKSGKSANKKGKGKNGGSNDASSGSARPNSLLPPKESPGKGNRSRTPSISNTPTSTPPSSPESKKETLSGVVSLLSRAVKGGSTDTESRERSGKQSTTTSPHTSPPKPQPSSLQRTPPPQTRKPIPQPTGEPNTTTAVVEVGPANKTLGPASSGTGLQDKQDNVKPAPLPTFDLPTPPASPEIQVQTVPAALEDGPAPSLLESPSGLADKDKQDDVKPAALLSSDHPTTAASPTVPADLETASDSQDKGTQDNVKSAVLPSSNRAPPGSMYNLDLPV
ncbi:hypothetical protein FRC04_007154 [Tulasnella sp. 424]|nr:hypothetical protein FRC04_007154 [Tulasnella sp. 424]